ncbi:hypothetical protein GGX14DRAFT_607323, partial [Mycena pura]
MGPHDAFFSQIPTADLLNLMHTCRVVHSLIRETCFDLLRLLSPFFGDATEVEKFRLMAAHTGALISGSTALQFFNRCRWPASAF